MIIGFYWSSEDFYTKIHSSGSFCGSTAMGEWAPECQEQSGFSLSIVSLMFFLLGSATPIIFWNIDDHLKRFGIAMAVSASYLVVLEILVRIGHIAVIYCWETCNVHYTLMDLYREWLIFPLVIGVALMEFSNLLATAGRRVYKHVKKRKL